MKQEPILNIAIQSLPVSSSGWVEILTALLTPTIAVLGTFIAYNQYRLSRQRLRLEAYDKKLNIVRTVDTYLTSIHARDRNLAQNAHNFKFDIAEAPYLFDKEIVDKLDEIQRNSLELGILDEEINTDANIVYPSEEIKVKRKEWTKLLGWHEKQISITREMFKPHMKVDGI